MATAVTYPGVYIEEVPSSVRTIIGVPTSVAAMVGYTSRGPSNKPQQIFSFADFERKFGGLNADSPLSYAVSQFFLNGGATAWIVRVAANAVPAEIALEDGVGGPGIEVLTATARSDGSWGNGLRVVVDYDTANPASLFNLTIVEFQNRDGVMVPVGSETHRNVTMNSKSPAYVVDKVNADSNLATLARPGGLTFTTAGQAVSGPFAPADLAELGDEVRTLAISIDGGPTYEFDFLNAGDALTGATFPARTNNLAARIEAAVRTLEPGNTAFSGFKCSRTATATQAVLTCTAGNAGPDRENSSVSFFNASRRNAAATLALGVQNGGREVAGATVRRPAQSGTAWIRQDPPIDFTTLAAAGALDIDIIDPDGTVVANEVVGLWPAAGASPGDLPTLVQLIQKALASATRPELASAQVSLVDDRIVFVAGGARPDYRLKFNSGPQTTGGTPIDLSTGAEVNVAAYQLGVGPDVAAQSGAVPGNDGTRGGTPELAGSRASKKGIYALEDVDIFNLLLIPDESDASLHAKAVAYAEERRAFAILDMPVSLDSLDEATGWITGPDVPRSKNAAVYFPRVQISDPLLQNRVRSFANSGTVAGIYARTDVERGVWKAPAGTDAGLRGVRGLDYVLTDPENGVINQLGLNALRNFTNYGPTAWGARTLFGADVRADQWKYVPVRRLALYIEESLYRGTKWVVFEPNDEPLWSQIRLNIGAFMHTLFRQGAFQGARPRDAYLVQCDSSTTTQDDINRGVVNITVGFAPLKPAEFVIIKLQQLAGQAGAGA